MALQPSPIEQDPQRIVENVHEVPGGHNFADYESRDEMETFLKLRMQGEQSKIRQLFGRWRTYTPVEKTRLGFKRWGYLHVPGVPKEDRLVTDGKSWRKWSLVGFVAANGVLNIVNGNVGDVVDNVSEEISILKDRYEDGRMIGDGEICQTTGTSTKEIITRESDTNREVFHYTPNPVGESTPNTSVIDTILDSIQVAQTDGDVSSISLEITGNTSDEWLGLGASQNFGYGQDEPTGQTNDVLGEKRQDDTESIFRSIADERGIDLSDIDIAVRHQQNTLNDETLAELIALSTIHGFSSLDEAQRTHNANPDLLPLELREALDKNFARKRDTEILLTINKHSESTEITVADGEIRPENCISPDGSPEDENHDYEWPLIPFLWPALPLFMRKRITKMKGSWVEIEGIRDPQKLLIHKDGVDQEQVLDKSAWAYVRKFMYLFREDNRIRKIYEHSFLDDKGEQQSLKALFVDHEPTPETVEMVGRMFQFASQIQNGRLGKECDAIAIYPRGHAGLHGQPKDVALGMDVQYEGSTLGVAIPSLGIIEMHMPDVPTDEERDTAYNSAAWVLAHELAGHFSDLNTTQNRLQNAGQNAIGKTVYTLPNRFDDAGLSQYRRGQTETDRANSQASNSFWRRLFRRPLGAASMRWRVRRGRGTLPTPEDAERTVQQITGTDDARLTEALHIKKQTGNPTTYGSGNAHSNENTAASEAWAEAAANKATGIAIPFKEAPERSAQVIRSEDAKRWVDGYHVSTNWDNTIDKRWGSITPSEATRFANQSRSQQHWKHRMGAPDRFDWARDLAKWARGVRIQKPEHNDWKEIIVGQAIKK